MKELELKLVVPAARRAGLLKALGLAKAPRIKLDAHYFDTPDGQLHRAGLSLRVRQEGQAWIQTLKATTDNPVARFEDSVPINGAAGLPVPAPMLERHEGHQVRKALRLALGDTAQADLREVYRTDIVRRYLTVPLKGDTVELAFDEGVIRADGRERPLCELELELKSRGTAAGLFAFAQDLVQTHGLWISTVSKSGHGAQLAAGPGAAAPVAKARPARFRPQASSGRQFRAMLGNCLSQIAPNASHVAAGSVDADQIHQLRVGIRRLRTLLREAASLVRQIPPDWEPVLRSVFQSLGAHRDQIAVSKALQPALEAAGAPLSVPPRAPTDAPSPQDAVRSAAFQTTLLALMAFTLVDGQGTGHSARKVLGQRIARLHRQVLRDGQRFTELDADAQHRVRKRLKRLRYISELAAPLFGAPAFERYLAHLRPAQDTLGQHNDGLVALENFKARTGMDGRAWFGVGWLTAHQTHTALACRKALKKMAKAPCFW